MKVNFSASTKFKLYIDIITVDLTKHATKLSFELSIGKYWNSTYTELPAGTRNPAD